MQQSIRIRLTILIIIAAVLPLLVVGALVAQYSFGVQRQQAVQMQQQVVERTAVSVQAFVIGLEDKLRGSVDVPDLGELSPERQTALLTRLLIFDDALGEVALLDAQGREIVHLSQFQPAAPGDDRSGEPAFQLPLTTGQIYYSPVRFDEINGQPWMTIALPLTDAGGDVTSVLVAEARLKSIWDLIAALPLREGDTVYIVDNTGRIIAHPDPGVVLVGQRFSVPAEDGFYAGHQSARVVLASSTLSFGEQTLTVVAERTVMQALTLAINTVVIIAVLVIPAALLVGGLALWYLRRAFQPIEALAESAQAVAAGDLSRKVAVRGRDEIATLAGAFNTMTQRLQETLGSLEQRVAERTEDLQRRSAYLVASAEVGQAAITLLDIEALTQRVAELIQERFNFYHVGLYLVDETGAWVNYRAGAGEAGQSLLADRLSLEIGGHSMVGWCIANQRPRVAADVRQETIRYEDARFPETRSEIALPLLGRGRVLGAINVQSRALNTFDADLVTALETMARLVAVAIENAQLFDQAQAAVAETQRAYGELGRQAWQSLLQARTVNAYSCDVRDVVRPVDTAWTAEMARAVAGGELVQADDEILVPIRGRDTVLGVVRFRKPETAETWADAEIGLMQTLTEQLSVALESARLYEDTQRRAAREQLTGEITARMRETLDVEQVLQTALQEIGKSLQLETEVWLGTHTEGAPQG